MRRASGLVVVGIAAALLASCGGKETVRVAFIGSFSGKLTANSTMGANAIDLYLSGPEAAKSRVKYEITTFDDRSDAGALDAIVADIRKGKFKFVIGPLPSAFAKKVRDLMEHDPTLQFGPLAAADVLAGLDDNFIKMYPSIREAAERLAAHVATLGLKRIAPIQDIANKDFCDAWIGLFKEVLGGRIEVADPITFQNPTDVNYPRIVQEVARMRADAVLLVTNTFDASMICQMLRKDAPSIALVCSSWCFNADFLSSTGRSSEGALFSAAFDGDSRDERYLRFRKNYQARFVKDVNEFAPTYCYESIQVLDRAINAARSSDPARVKETIIRIGTFEGLQGDFTIDRYGDAKRDFRIIAVKDGKYSVVR